MSIESPFSAQPCTDTASWQKSSFSGGNDNCVEVAVAPDGTIRLRESDRPEEVVTTTRAKWAAFVRGVKAGEFDHLATPGS